MFSPLLDFILRDRSVISGEVVIDVRGPYPVAIRGLVAVEIRSRADWEDFVFAYL